MKQLTCLFLFSLVVFVPQAFAANGTAATAANIRPDGSAVTENFTTAGASTAWFYAFLTVGHSYVAEVEAPFNGLGTLSGGVSPALSLGIFRNDGTTPVFFAFNMFACAPSTSGSGDRVTFTPSAADFAAGPIKISVTNGVAPNYSFRFRLYETGLSCPRWSINGYLSFVDLQNTSDCAVDASLILYRSDGSVASTTPVFLDANGATQISISGAMAGGVFFGSAAVFHTGPKGAITGGIYQVQPGTASGANFSWPFTEIRSSGSTCGQ